MSDCPKHGTPRKQRYRGGRKAGWVCAECTAAYSVKWRGAHRDEKAEYHRVWAAANRGRLAEYQKEWRRRRDNG